MIRTLWGRMVILGGFFGIGLAIYAFIYSVARAHDPLGLLGRFASA